MHVSTRTGWRDALGGRPNPVVMNEINRDYVIKHSYLRDKEGFKEKKMDKYDDLGLASTYSKINRVSEMASGRDGSTMIVDAKDAMYNVGGANKRQLLHSAFRSAYDCYSSSGEPIITTLLPPAKLCNTTECLDYIFHSEGSLIASKVLSLPSWQSMRCGANPEASYAVPDYSYLIPFNHVTDLFDMQLMRILTKMDEDKEDGENQSRDVKMVNRSVSYTNEDVRHFKRLLKPYLQRSHGSSSNNTGNAKPKSAKKGSRAKSPGLQRVASIGNGLLGPDFNFFGGRWSPFAIRNSARSNYYFPTGSYGSSHMCLGVEFLVDDMFLTTTYATDAPL